jgi:hypothetical protein
MVIEYLREKYGENNVPRLSIKTIARAIDTKEEGTAPKDIEKINKFFKAKLSVQFKTQFMAHFPDIRKELEEERPVIVWLNCVTPPDVVWHAVVVCDFDPETDHVSINDPWDGSEKSEEVGTFIKKWGTEARLVKVLISKEQQRYLDDDWSTEHIVNGEPTDE